MQLKIFRLNYPNIIYAIKDIWAKLTKYCNNKLNNLLKNAIEDS